jgi:hypothetical protein
MFFAPPQRNAGPPTRRGTLAVVVLAIVAIVAAVSIWFFSSPNPR